MNYPINPSNILACEYYLNTWGSDTLCAEHRVLVCRKSFKYRGGPTKSAVTSHWSRQTVRTASRNKSHLSHIPSNGHLYLHPRHPLNPQPNPKNTKPHTSHLPKTHHNAPLLPPLKSKTNLSNPNGNRLSPFDSRSSSPATTRTRNPTPRLLTPPTTDVRDSHGDKGLA